MKNTTLAAALIAITALTMPATAQASPAAGTASQPPGAVGSSGTFDGSLANDLVNMQLLGIIEYGEDVLLLIVPGEGHGGGGGEYPGCFRTENGVICYLLARIEPGVGAGSGGYTVSFHAMSTEGALEQVAPEVNVTISQVDTIEMVLAHAIALSADPAP